LSSSDDWKKTVRLNKLLGMWAAEKLGITGREAEAYSDALAVGTLDPERSDVFSKIRKDFDAAGVVQSDEQILHVMNELTLQAGSLGDHLVAGTATCMANGFLIEINFGHAYNTYDLKIEAGRRAGDQ